MHFLFTHGLSTASFLFLHILFRRTPTVISIGVLRSGRTDWVCFGDARPFLLSGGPQIHTAEPLFLYFMSSALDPWSIVGGRHSRDIR
jgi:hypothetical protein